THQHIHTFPTRRSSDLKTYELSEKSAPNNVIISVSERKYKIKQAILKTSSEIFNNRTTFSEKPRLFLDTALLANIIVLNNIGIRSEEHTSELQSRENLV